MFRVWGGGARAPVPPMDPPLFVPKSRLISAVVLTERRLVTDRRTDRHRVIAIIALAQQHRVSKETQ